MCVSWSFPGVSGVTPKQLLEHHGFVVQLIPGCVDECDAPPPRKFPKLGQRLAVLQLGAISLLELRPSDRIVPEPLAQLGGRCDLLEPEIDSGLGLGQTSWPEAIDKDALAIAACRRFISALQHHIHGSPLERTARRGPKDANCIGRADKETKTRRQEHERIHFLAPPADSRQNVWPPCRRDRKRHA